MTAEMRQKPLSTAVVLHIVFSDFSGAQDVWKKTPIFCIFASFPGQSRCFIMLEHADVTVVMEMRLCTTLTWKPRLLTHIPMIGRYWLGSIRPIQRTGFLESATGCHSTVQKYTKRCECVTSRSSLWLLTHSVARTSGVFTSSPGCGDG